MSQDQHDKPWWYGREPELARQKCKRCEKLALPGGWVIPVLIGIVVLVLIAGAAANAQSGSYYNQNMSNKEYVDRAMQVYEQQLAQNKYEDQFIPRSDQPYLAKHLDGTIYTVYPPGWYHSPIAGPGRYDQSRYEIRCWWQGKVWTCR